MTNRRKVFGLEANENVRTGWHPLPDPEPEEEGEEVCSVEQLHDALKVLTTRQRFVLELRYGMRDGAVYSYGEIADLMGISKQAIFDHEQAAIVRLQKQLDDSPPMVDGQ